MKRMLIALAMMMLGVSVVMGQKGLNGVGDNIVGVYEGMQGGEKYKAKIVKLKNGTYRGQIIWMENPNDAKGKKRLDAKNPDEKLRCVPCDQVVLFSGLEYNAKKQRWDGTKIYDPQRGMRAKMTAEFEKDGRLKIRGSVMGIGESVYWTKVKE